MTFQEYHDETIKTAGFGETDPGNLGNANTLNAVFNCLLGLGGEVGELQDYFKKCIYMGHGYDALHETKELGDILWYLDKLAWLLGTSLADVANLNIEKLRERYPDGFSIEASVNRKEYRNAG